MNRRTFLRALIGASGLALIGIAARGRSDRALAAVAQDGTGPVDHIVPLEKSRDYWRELLEPERFRILFRAGTERAFSSPLNEEKRDGTYICAACYLPLFSSEDKYDSGTGWPSFVRALPGRIGTSVDYKLIFPRTEYHCARCGGHQGHVFEDGPPPTGQRWCNNGLALLFVPDGQPLPELRS